jgi:hypothetical protein
VASQNFFYIHRSAKRCVESSTNCLVVIGARPTRSLDQVSVLGRKGAGNAELGAGDQMRHRFARVAGQLLEQALRQAKVPWIECALWVTFDRFLAGARCRSYPR